MDECENMNSSYSYLNIFVKLRVICHAKYQTSEMTRGIEVFQLNTEVGDLQGGAKQ